MVDFVDSMEFDRLGVFPYSAEEGTKAAEMDGQITEEVKESRRDEIMALQQEISADKAASRIDDEMSVLIEGWKNLYGCAEGRRKCICPGGGRIDFR